MAKVLLIEDDQEEIKQFETRLGGSQNRQFYLDCVDTIEASLKRLDKENFDAIILDLTLKGTKGTESFAQLREKAPHLPLVLLTDLKEEDWAIKILSQGAQDYLVKGTFDGPVLLRILRYAIERKRTENELARLANFPELNPEAIFELDVYGRILYANPAARGLFPEIETEKLEHPFLSEWASLVKGLRASERRLFTREVAIGERAYEEDIHYLDQPQHILIYVREITERKQLERLKEVFLQNVSHEMQTPLTVIYGTIQNLLSLTANKLSAEERTNLVLAEKNTKHLSEMVEDMLELTRSRVGKLLIEPRRSYIDEVLSDVIHTFEMTTKTRGLRLTLDAPDDLPPAYVDPIRLKQVLTNLVGNAVKFTPKAGKITVKAEVFDKKQNSLLISVKDTGCGIPQDAVAKIFERLYQSANTMKLSRKGLGIGLSICKELVTRQGGQIWVESKIGEGSTFFFTLPIFSLEKMLYPYLIKENRMAESVSLIIAEVIPPSEEIHITTAQQIMQAARDVLAKNTLADDLVLPPMTNHPIEGILYLIACTPPQGAEAMVKRIQKHFQVPPFTDDPRFMPKIKSVMIEVLPSEQKALEDRVKSVAASIEKLLSATI